MKEDLQNMIEEYVLGKLSETDKANLEEILKTDTEANEAFEKTKIIREALIKSNARHAVNEARQSLQTTPKIRFWSVVGSFAAAASILLILMSTPVSFNPIEFNTRGAKDDYAGETISKLTADFETAQRDVIENRNLDNSIKILNHLKSDTLVSEAYQLQSKWLLVNAYLRSGDARNAEITFKEINCTINCPFSAWDKIKIQWQIFWGKLI